MRMRKQSSTSLTCVNAANNGNWNIDERMISQGDGPLCEGSIRILTVFLRVKFTAQGEGKEASQVQKGGFCSLFTSSCKLVRVP